MASPTSESMASLKRLCRYQIGKPRVVFQYPWQSREMEILAYSDSDWAGCRKTGRSTSGGCLMRGAHYLKGWSKTQHCVTLSSAEAELVAMNKAAAELLGMLSLMTDLGECGRTPCSPGDSLQATVGENQLQGILCGDSSAAIAISNRKGCGKLRHIHMGELWIQEKTPNG